MPLRGKPSLILASILPLLASTPAYSQPPDLTYHTVAPCTVLDTRVAGGAFAAGETRTYNVAGSGSLASQGGSSTGCNVPGFSNNIPQVQAVALNIVAVLPTGVGNIQAFAADTTTTTSVLNMTANQHTANTAPVAVAQTSGLGDFKLKVNFSSAHVLVSVVGYYSKAVQTVYVHPVPGDNTASGTRLIDALAGIANASATKRYVMKVEPGIYDVGSSGLQMKAHVDIEGSGQEATVIRGEGGSEEATTGVVVGAASSEIRNLQVKAESTDYATIGILLPNGANTSIRNVTITASGSNSNWGLRNLSNTSSKIEDVSITTTGGTTGYGIGNKFQNTAPIIKRTVINVTGGSSTRYGISAVYGSLPEIRDVQVDVSGGFGNYGVYLEQSPSSYTAARITGSTIQAADTGVYFAGDQLNIEQSQIRAADASGIGVDGGNGFGTLIVDHSEITGAEATVTGIIVRIGASRLNGGPVVGGSATCAGVYDESFIFYASTCP